MIGRRQFLSFLAGAAATPLATRIAAALPVLEPVRARYASGPLAIAEITREAVRLFTNSNEFIRNIDRQYGEQYQGSAAIGFQLRIRLPNDYQVHQ